MNRVARKLQRALIAGLCCTVCLCAQNTGDYPKPCGPGTVSDLPPNVSVLTDGAIGSGYLAIRVQVGDSWVDVKFPDGIFSGPVGQACRVSADRLLIFGELLGHVAYNIALIDVARGKLVDELWAYSPVLSPDKRWLIMREFYPAQAPDTSELYLIYDMTKDPPPHGTQGQGTSLLGTPGVLVYPVEENGKPFATIGLPATEKHTFLSKSLYWSDDSKTVIFVDGMQDGCSVVLVAIGKDGPRTYIHPVPMNEVGCSLSNARFNALPNGANDVFAEFDLGYGPKSLVFRAGDFHPATPQKHAPRPPRKRAAPASSPN